MNRNQWNSCERLSSIEQTLTVKKIWPIERNRNFNIANSAYANPAMQRPAVAQIHGMKLQYLHGIELHGMKINDVIKLIC